jgi:hypothetical protein
MSGTVRTAARKLGRPQLFARGLWPPKLVGAYERLVDERVDAVHVVDRRRLHAPLQRELAGDLRVVGPAR